jgi:hypothetical protein
MPGELDDHLVATPLAAAGLQNVVNLFVAKPPAPKSEAVLAFRNDEALARAAAPIQTRLKRKFD